MNVAFRVVSPLASKFFVREVSTLASRLHDADIFTGVVASNLQVFINDLIYSSAPGRQDRNIAGVLRDKLAKYQSATAPPEDVPLDWSQFQPRLLRVLQDEFRRCGARIKDGAASRDPLLTQLSLDGGVALQASQRGAVQTHTLRARWIFDGCRTFAGLQQRSKQLVAWLSLVDGEQWEVEPSTAGGAFQLGDYVHLTRQSTTGGGAPRKSFVFSNDSVPSASQAQRSREADDFLTRFVSPRSPGGQAATLPASVRHCEELQLVGPVGRDEDGSVTHYGTLTWSSDGAPRFAVTAQLNPSRRDVIASLRGAQQQPSRAKPAGRVDRGAMPFQTHLAEGFSRDPMVAGSDAVLVQKLCHDPFRRLPQCQMLTWRLFQLNLHWRGDEGMLCDIVPQLFTPASHPLYAGTGHSGLGLHWQSSAAEMFFNMSDTDGRKIWDALFVALLETADDETKSTAMLWCRGQAQRPRAARYRGCKDAVMLYHHVRSHAEELGRAGVTPLLALFNRCWRSASPVGDGIQKWLEARHLVEADEAFEPSGLWIDGFVDAPPAEARTPGVEPVTDVLSASEPDRLVYRINKRVAPFALAPQPMAREQAEWLRRRSRLVAFQHAKIAARNGNVDTIDPPRSRFFQLWGCDQLLALDGLQPQRLTDGVGGLDCLPRTQEGRCLAIPLDGVGGRQLSRCRDIERPVVPRIFINEPEQHDLLRDALRKRLRSVEAGVGEGATPPKAATGSESGGAGAADLIGGAPGSSAFPHFGVFPVVVPPSSDAGSDLQPEHEWRMELSVKSAWNGVRSISEASSRVNQLAAMFARLEKEGWQLDQPVQDGRLQLACASERVAARFCVTNCVQFGVWPEIRRLGDDEDELFKGDTYLPYTQADLDLLSRHNLLQPGELDHVLDVHSAARAAVLDELLRHLVAHAQEPLAGARISLEVGDDALRVRLAEREEPKAD